MRPLADRDLPVVALVRLPPVVDLRGRLGFVELAVPVARDPCGDRLPVSPRALRWAGVLFAMDREGSRMWVCQEP